MEQGFAAVSHRSVAERATLPLSATTYYFTSLEELVHAAVSALFDSWLGGVRTLVADCPPHMTEITQVADTLFRVVAYVPAEGENAIRKGLHMLYDRYLEAARHSHLRSVITRYDEQLDTLLADILCRGGLPHDVDTARLVLAVMDGALLRALAEGAPVSSARVPLEQFLRSLPCGERASASATRQVR